MEKGHIANREYIFGLEWSPLAVGFEKPEAEIKRLSKQLNYAHGVIRKGMDAAQVGFCRKEFAGGYSAAAHLAGCVSDALLVEEIGDGHFWLCLIRGGMVVPGGDATGDLDEIKRLYNEMLSMSYMDDSSHMHVYAHGLQHEFPESYDESFSDLVHGASPGKDEKISAIGGLSSGSLVAVLAIAVIAGAYFVYASRNAPIDSGIGVDDVPVLPDFSQRKPKVSMEEIVAKAKEEEVARYNVLLARQSSSAAAGFFAGMVKKMPLHKNGYRIERAEYSPVDAMFKMYWVSDGKNAFVKNLSPHFSGASINVFIDSNTAVETVPVVSEIGADSVDAEQLLVSHKNDYLLLTSVFQKLPIVSSWGVNEQIINTRFEPISGIEGVDATKTEFPMIEYKWRVAGRGLWYLPIFARDINEFKATLIDRLEINRKTGIENEEWIVEGTTYRLMR